MHFFSQISFISSFRNRFFYSAYMPPGYKPPPFISPPKTPYEVIEAGALTWDFTVSPHSNKLFISRWAADN